MATVNNFDPKSYQIDIPFSFSSAGSVSFLADTDPQVWKNKVISAMLTNLNERLFYDNYGAGLLDLAFDSSSDAINDGVASITEIFVSWLPELTLTEVVPSYDSGLGQVAFTIIYSLPSGNTDSVKITTASLTAAGELREVSNG